MNRMKIAMLAGVAAMGISGTIFAQSGDSAVTDKQFLMDAAEGNKAEITASQLALKKSKNPDVKAYAQQMIDDHMKLMASMKPLNDQMGVGDPMLNPTHKAEAQRLSAMSGSQFDMEYVKAMVADHHKTLGMMKNEDQTTQNAQVKSTVETAIPIIKDHTDKIDAMAQKMNIPVPTMAM